VLKKHLRLAITVRKREEQRQSGLEPLVSSTKPGE
jgi:hypothetical protein